LKEKVILVDCDGVLCDWEYSFKKWMTRHAYEVVSENEYDIATMYGLEKIEAKKLVRMFNESATIRKLPPLRDAIKYVKKLHEEHGYIFHVITSLSDDEYAQHLRTKNLCELFGPTVFETYTYLDCGADKDEALAKYKDTECWWVEDKPENALVGASLGLNSILMAHTHNALATSSVGDAHIKRALSWKDIYSMITDE
jgi:FMN phosphatase YigB (HAD superfamily)